MGNKTDGSVIEVLVDTVFEQAVEEIVSSGMWGVGARRFGQGTRKQDLDGLTTEECSVEKR